MYVRLGFTRFFIFSTNYSMVKSYKTCHVPTVSPDPFSIIVNTFSTNILISHQLQTLKKYYFSGDSSVCTDGFERLFVNLLDIKNYEVKGTVGFRNNVGGKRNTLQNIDIKDFFGTIYEVNNIKFVLAHF